MTSSAPDGRHIDTRHAVAPCRPFLGCSREAVEPGDDLYVLESRRSKRVDDLCFQQSASNSTRPEIDGAHGAVWQLLANDDVC
jgi:hypothetical protein